ncbi:MAG: hypothetical protein GY839_10505 [candidate division Zixibacteria bacterium]|nr:hypothetical protein [candidate division Zixibacteria bacterium]
MKTIHRTAILIIPVILIEFCCIHAQETDQHPKNIYDSNQYYGPPENESEIMGGIGGGLGVPYGVIGSNFSIGNKLATLDMGMGIIPFTDGLCFSIGGSFHFLNRYSGVRPKVSAFYSNAVAVLLSLEEGTFKSLYDEKFAGSAAYIGVDIRMSKTSNWCLDLNLGMVFPTVGFDEIEARWEEAKNDLSNQGYILEDELKNLNSPKISVGLRYSFGRSLIFKGVGQ